MAHMHKCVDYAQKVRLNNTDTLRQWMYQYVWSRCSVFHDIPPGGLRLVLIQRGERKMTGGENGKKHKKEWR